MSIADIFETMTYGPARESTAPALDWLERHAPALHLVIANRSVPPLSGECFESVNPATGRPLIKIAQAGAADVDAAVAAARAASATWSRTPGHVRARYLYALARQVQKHARLLAVLETLATAKPIREAPVSHGPPVAGP